MKKFLAAMTFVLGLGLANAQQTQPATSKTPPPPPPKEARMAKKTDPKMMSSATPRPAGKMKADGTPDKRFKENKKLKKDGTPDKRFKENK